jgi:hypothetical protein
VLEIACVCKHPNALWLTKLFAGRDVSTPEQARRSFLGCEDDSRALCFAAFFDVAANEFGQLLRRSVDLGDAFAQARLAQVEQDEGNDVEMFRRAEKSAAQGERDGYYWLGICYQYGRGRIEDVERAKEYFLAAAELGDTGAMDEYCSRLEGDEPCFCFWVGKAAERGSLAYEQGVRDQMDRFISGDGNPRSYLGLDESLKVM